MRRVSIASILVGAVGLTGLLACATGCAQSCRDGGAVDAGPAGELVVRQAKLDDAARADPVAALAKRVPPRSGSCAQVRSMPDQGAAESVAEQIRKALALPVELMKADLGERGTWWRICVGQEESDGRLVARATRWTAPGGELEPFLDPPEDDRPRFHVLRRENAEPRKAEKAQAEALLGFALVDGAPVVFFGGPAKDALAAAGTAGTEDGASDIVAADASGRRLALSPAPPPGCATCTLALREGAVKARKTVAAGDVGPDAGEELLVEETTERGVRLLSIYAVENGALVRKAGMVLENARAGFAQSGTAAVVEADADPQKEIVLATTELRLSSGQTGELGCELERHATLFDWQQKGLVKLDPVALPATPEDAIINVVTALDAWADHDAASRTCAAQLARTPQAATAQLCVSRVRRLIEDGQLIDAVSAAGLIAESSPALRAAIAGPFHDAADALDKDPRLFAGEIDCKSAPLVDNLASRTMQENLKVATAKKRERVALADVADAVFVTGARDFGRDSPVGSITARWLERMHVGLPARYAAIEALLLPAPAPAPAAAAAPDAGQAAAAPPGPGFGGSP